MRTYELMVVVRPDFAADDDAKRQALVQGLIGEGVTVGNISVMGKKRLAYAIKKQTEGVYLLATLTARGLKSADIEKRANLHNDVIRYLLTATN